MRHEVFITARQKRLRQHFRIYLFLIGIAFLGMATWLFLNPFPNTISLTEEPTFPSETEVTLKDDEQINQILFLSCGDFSVAVNGEVHPSTLGTVPGCVNGQMLLTGGDYAYQLNTEAHPVTVMASQDVYYEEESSQLFLVVVNVLAAVISLGVLVNETKTHYVVV